MSAHAIDASLESSVRQKLQALGDAQTVRFTRELHAVSPLHQGWWSVDGQAEGSLLWDARGAKPIGSWAGPTLHVAWKKGEYLRLQDRVKHGMAPTDAVDIPFLAQVDDLWDEMQAGFANSTITEVPGDSLPVGHLLRVELPFSWWDDDYQVHLRVGETGNPKGVSVVHAATGEDVVMPSGVRLNHHFSHRKNVPLDPDHMGPYAVADSSNPNLYASPVTRAVPYYETQTRALWSIDPSQSTSGTSMDMISPVATETCDTIQEWSVSSQVTLLPPGNAAASVESAMNACAKEPWFEYGVEFGGGVGFGIAACAEVKVELLDDRSIPPVLVGTHVQTVCKAGDNSSGMRRFRDTMGFRSPVSDIAPVPALGDLRMVVTTTATVNCTEAGLGQKAFVRATLVPKSPSPHVTLFRDSLAPGYRWDGCYPDF